MKLRWLPLALIAIFLPLLAHAGTLTLDYTQPTACADGSSLTMCPTTGFEILGGTTPTGTYTTLETVGPTVTQRVYQNLTPGTYCRTVKTVSNSQKSAEGLRACAEVPNLPPKAPAGISVTINLTVTTAVTPPP